MKIWIKDMKKRFLTHSLLVVFGCLWLVPPASAAYIDPNTGGMLFQVLAAIFAVLSGFILIFSSRIKMLFFRILRFFNGSKQDAPAQEDETKG